MRARTWLAMAVFGAAALSGGPAGAEYIYRHRLIGAAPLMAGAAAAAPSGTRLFVSASAYTGNLGGLAGADAKCMADANKPSDGRTYVAVLSTVGQDAKSRVAVTYPVRLAAAPTTLVDSTDLWDGTLTAALVADPNIYVWTGTTASGTKAGDYCGDWTNGTSGQIAQLGRPSSTGSWWIANGPMQCHNSYRLLCASTTP